MSLELHKSADGENFIEELEEFLKIMDNEKVEENEFYKYLDLDHEDEDCAFSSRHARNYCTHVPLMTMMTFQIRQLPDLRTNFGLRPRASVAKTPT